MTRKPTRRRDTGRGDGGDSGGSFDFGGWFAETSNYDGTTADRRGQSAVTIDVGVQANGGAFGFGPAAVHIDPGTTVTWEWAGGGGQHNVVAESGADFRSGDPTNEAGHTFEHTLDGQGLVKYFCSPHRSLGMRGGLVVGDPDAATATPTAGPEYGFQAATFDAYWYSLYNMSTNIAMSGNGVPSAAVAQRERRTPTPATAGGGRRVRPGGRLQRRSSVRRRG